ncbi:hypothetical protein BH23ACT5_BH23ACT5_14340 [soil metagenome]
MALPNVAPQSITGHDLESLLALRPGRITELDGVVGSGLTRFGLRMLAGPSRRTPVVAVDVKGWISPMAAWEVGVDPTRLVVVRCPDPALWPQVAGVLVEGVSALYAEVPVGVKDGDLRRLTALARARRAGVVLRPCGPELPSGVAHLRLRAVEVRWEGSDRGHGRLTRRHLVMEATGKAVAGMRRRIEVIDDGSDLVRVVPGVGLGEGDRVAG